MSSDRPCLNRCLSAASLCALVLLLASSCSRRDRDAGRVMAHLDVAVGVPMTLDASWYVPEGTDLAKASIKWSYEKPPADVEDVITSFTTPTKFGVRYGARICGYIHPPVTGNYTFWIASHDQSELWLSGSDDPRERKKIAEVLEATEPKKWDKEKSQKSAPLKLEKDKRYYVEAFHKQDKGVDHFSVVWQIPKAKREVIAGKYLSEYTGTDEVRPGGLSRTVWKEISGGRVSDLTTSPRLRDDLVVEIVGVRLPVASFTPPAPGDYLISLTVQTARSVTYQRRVIIVAQ